MSLKKKTLIAVFICFFLAVFVTVAGANDKSSIAFIDISVVLDENGSGIVSETWDMEIFGGTENYKQIFNLKGNESISDFSVSENSIPYEFVDNWNVDAPRAGKINKCGIHYTNEGIELCWGIGADNGRHVYTIRYVINRMVTLEKDEDGSEKAALYWKFIGEPFQYTENVRVRVRTPRVIGDTYNFWIFGFNGEILINGNEYEIAARQVREGHFVELALVMPAGDFPLASGSGGSRLQRIYKNGKSGNELGRYNCEAPGNTAKAFLEGPQKYIIGFPLIFTLVFVFFLVKKMTANNLKRKVEKHTAVIDMPRESLEAMAYLLATLHYSPDILNTFMLKWINEKYIELNKTGGKFLFIKYDTHTIKMNAPPESFEGDLEKRYYDLIYGIYIAACMKTGSNTMDSGDFTMCMTENRSTLREILRHIKKTGVEYCHQKGWMIEPETIKKQKRKSVLFNALFIVLIFGSMPFIGSKALLLFSGYILAGAVVSIVTKSGNHKYLTIDGEKMFDDILGFGNYLWNYSLLEKNGVKHIESWDSYLAFANLVGISKNLRLEFVKISPSYEDTSRCFPFMDSGFYCDPLSASSDSSGGSGDSGGGGGGSGGGGGGTR